MAQFNLLTHDGPRGTPRWRFTTGLVSLVSVDAAPAGDHYRVRVTGTQSPDRGVLHLDLAEAVALRDELIRLTA